MGSGTKEKVARLAAESQLSNELNGLRTLLLFVFGCVVFFTISLAGTLSTSLESPQQHAQLMAKLTKERNERMERLKKRNIELMAIYEKPVEDQSWAVARQRTDEDEIPPWASPRDAKAQKNKRKKLIKAEEEVLEEFNEQEADLEIRTKMAEWIREAASVRERVFAAPQDVALVSLTKRQQFVESGLDAVTARDPELDDFNLKVLLDTSITSNTKKTPFTSLDPPSSSVGSNENDGDERDEASEQQKEPIVGVSGTNSAFKALRTSNLFVLGSTAHRADKLFGSHLSRLGYSAAPAGSKSLPMWVLGYGSKCPDIPDPTARHVLVCPVYVPSFPGIRHIPLHLMSRDPVQVLERLVLPRSRHKRSDGKALSQALGEVYGSEIFAPEVFRLFRDKAKLESHLARDAERKPIFVLQQNDGMTAPQLTNNVPSLLAGEKKYASKQLVLRRYDLNPTLWDGKKFILRSYTVVFSSDPFLALYLQGPVLQASTAFAKPGPTNVEMAPASVHFPGVSNDAQRFTASKLFKSLGVRDPAYILKRMKQLSLFALLSMEVLSKGSESEGGEARSRQIGVQHLCFDFVLKNAGTASETVILEDGRTDCPMSPGNEERALVDAVAVLAEEMLVRKSRQEQFGFLSLPSFDSVMAQTRLEVLVDEPKELAKGRSLLDVLEDLTAARTAISSTSTSGKGLSCENPVSILGEGLSYSTFVENFPACSTSDLDALFSTAAIVGKEERVDEETFFNSKIERSLQVAIQGLFIGNFRSSVNEARLAGYAPCARFSKGLASAMFVPASKGLSPIAVKMFSCNADDAKNKDVIIEIPHPLFDHTRTEGLALFEAGVAKALIVSGTHRCAVAPLSKCTGSIGKRIRTNCGEHRPEYQNGDAAHAVETTFHTAHVSFAGHLPDSVILSLHSTRQESFIVSDGTSNPVQPSASVARVVSALVHVFKSNPIASCNDFENSPTKRKLSESERDVCGATNVQGRHLNGAEDPCTAKVYENGSPLKSSGRFVHIEQPVQLLNENEQGLIRGMERVVRQALL